MPTTLYLLTLSNHWRLCKTFETVMDRKELSRSSISLTGQIRLRRIPFEKAIVLEDKLRLYYPYLAPTFLGEEAAPRGTREYFRCELCCEIRSSQNRLDEIDSLLPQAFISIQFNETEISDYIVW